MNTFLSGNEWSALLSAVDTTRAEAKARQVAEQERRYQLLAQWWQSEWVFSSEYRDTSFRDRLIEQYGYDAVWFVEDWIVDMTEPGSGGEDERLAVRKALPLILSSWVERGEEEARYQIELAYERQDEAEAIIILLDRPAAQGFVNWYEHAASAQARIETRIQYVRTVAALAR